MTEKEIFPGVHLILDGHGDACSLIIGSEKALLFDTMLGIGDLKGFVRTITDLPLTVVNSHGHIDHIGGDFQFPEVYLNHMDWPVFENSLGLIPELVGDIQELMSEDVKTHKQRPELKDYGPGDAFDLGGIRLKVIGLPGHTPGSMGLLYEAGTYIDGREHPGILLVGDAVSPQECLLFDESLSLEVYQRTLRGLDQYDFDWFVGAHFEQAFPREIIGRFIEAASLPGRHAKGYRYRFSLIPRYRGILYILDMRNELIDDAICIITKNI